MSDEDDIFSRVLSFIDDHKESFKDLDYKTIVEAIADSRKKKINYYRIKVYAPTAGHEFGSISWSADSYCVPLTDDDARLVKDSGLILVSLLQGHVNHSIYESNFINLTCKLLPVVHMSKIDKHNAYARIYEDDSE